jgi:hypothetical protein
MQRSFNEVEFTSLPQPLDLCFGFFSVLKNHMTIENEKGTGCLG